MVQLQSENDFLSEKVHTLESVNSDLQSANSDLQESLNLQEEENKRLYQTLLLLKRDRFGAKSEPYIDPENIPEQLPLFNELERDASVLPRGGEEETESISYERRKKGQGSKKPFPEDLSREEVVIDLNEDEKFCPHDGHPLKEIGEERIEKLKTVPAQSTVVIEIKKKYACPCCEGYVTQAPTASILPRTTATPELLSFLIFSKFFQALPFYRLEEWYKLQKIHLTRGTMARWLIQVSEELLPLWNILEEKVLECGYMAIDATHVQVLKEEGRSPQSKSFMWARGSPEQNIVLFDYDVSGGGKGL